MQENRLYLRVTPTSTASSERAAATPTRITVSPTPIRTPTDVPPVPIATLTSVSLSILWYQSQLLRRRVNPGRAQQLRQCRPPSQRPVPTQLPLVEVVGDVVDVTGVKVVVAGWSEFRGNELAKPTRGNVFVAVDLVIINSKDVPTDVSEALAFSLAVGNEATYRPNAIASLAVVRGTVGGVVSPDEPVRGASVYELPAENIGGLTLVISSGDRSVAIELGEAPIEVSIGPRFEGELEQTLEEIGREAKTGNLALSIVGWDKISDGLLFKPVHRQRAVAVQVLICNQGSSVVSFASFAQAALKDADHRRYGADLLVTVETGGGIDGSLAAGDTVRRKVGFTIPFDTEARFFTFDARLFEGSKVFVGLGTDPVSPSPADR